MRAMTMTVGVVMACVLMGAGGASAQSQAEIEVRAVAFKQVTEQTPDGRERVSLVDAELVVPNDTVVYEISARNRSQQVAERVVITDPIPEHMVYVDGSAVGEGAAVEFSVDGGKRFAPASRLQVPGDDGTSRAAGPSDYTHVRWTLTTPLAPTAERAVRFAARVE